MVLKRQNSSVFADLQMYQLLKVLDVSHANNVRLFSLLSFTDMMHNELSI